MCYRAAPRWGVALPFLMLFACGGEDPKAPPPTGPSLAAGPVLMVSVAGPSKLAVGACAQVTAAGTDVDNQRATATSGGFILRPNFKVASVAPLDPTNFSARDTLYGQICGIANGFTRVSAFLDNAAGNEVMVDVGNPVAGVEVQPGSTTVRVGATVQLAAFAIDQFGTKVGRNATWTSSNPAVMTVNSLGVVTGVSVGTATITATIAGKSASASVITNINGGTISGPGVITSPGTYSWTANPTPSGTYTYRWNIITYGNNQHFALSGKTISLVVGQTTGNISLQVSVYLGSALVGSLQPKVVGVNLAPGGCTGKKC